MTILTKPSNEKKSEKITLPLPLGRAQDEVSMLNGGGMAHGTLMAQQRAYSNSEADAESMVFNRPHSSCLKTVLLFLISVIVLLMGILGGYTLYRMYAPAHSSMHYRALCHIPYSSQNNASVPHIYAHPDDLLLNWNDLLPHYSDDRMNDMVDDNFFREEIELDMTDDESYAKIDVPDFKDGRRGRFMHDFKVNQSAIIDTTAKRCFIMPLDRETTLPPNNFLDLVAKMHSGYYNIDTDRVRRKMSVVMPPISDLSIISERIANECLGMKAYLLKNYVSGVYKRAAKPVTEAGKFAEFLGKGVVEFDLINIADIEMYESNQQK